MKGSFFTRINIILTDDKIMFGAQKQRPGTKDLLNSK